MSEIQLGDIFTDEELEKAQRLGNANDICEQITTPALEKINKATGQENDPKYWAYVLESVLVTNRSVK